MVNTILLQWFFPVCHESHYFVMVIGVKTLTAVIMDNSNNAERGALDIKYANIPVDLV